MSNLEVTRPKQIKSIQLWTPKLFIIHIIHKCRVSIAHYELRIHGSKIINEMYDRSTPV